MSEVVEIARSWIGTPYVHQASVKASGTDCLGLVRGVWREIFGEEPERVPSYSRDWAEPQGAEVLLEAATRHLTRKSRAEQYAAGDLLLFRMRDDAIAKHLGIVAVGSPEATFVHAYSGHGVVESSLTPPWARRVVACFAFPIMTDGSV